MDIAINIGLLEKKIDAETGSILFYNPNFIGLPDDVIHGKGYTIEMKNNEVVIVDIFNPSQLITHLYNESIYETV